MIIRTFLRCLAGLLALGSWCLGEAPMADVEQLLRPERLLQLEADLQSCRQWYEDTLERQWERVVFLQNTTAGRNETQQFAANLQQARDAVHKIASQVAAMYEYLDNYSGDDWQRRFGDSGIYQKAITWRQTLRIWEIYQHYYHAALCQALNDPGKAASLKVMEEVLPELDTPARMSFESAAIAETLRNKIISLQSGELPQLPGRQTSLDYRVRRALREGLTRPHRADPLQALLREEPQSAGLVLELIAAQLAARLYIPGDRDWLIECQPQELIALGYYLQEELRFNDALEVYHQLQNQKTNHEGIYPLLNYRIGWCHFQLAQQDPHNLEIGVPKALEAWLPLIKEYPGWTGGDSRESSFNAAVLAAHAAYRLGKNRDEVRDSKLWAAMESLVGRLPEGGGPPEGPWAQTPEAREFHYYYGLMLEQRRQYALAGRWLALTGPEDKNHANALYHKIHCLRQAQEEQNRTPEQRQNQITGWIKDLESLLPTEPLPEGLSDWSVPAMLSLADLYLQSQPSQPQCCREVLRRYAAWWEHREATATFLCGLQLEVRAYLLDNDIAGAVQRLHTLLQEYFDDRIAQLTVLIHPALQKQIDAAIMADDLLKMSAHLRVILPLMELLYKHPKESGTAEARAERYCYLEYLCLACYACHRLGWDMETQIAQAEAVMSKVNETENQTSFRQIRCRAFLAFGKGSYLESQALWQQLRGALNPDDPAWSNPWWEARCQGLRCLLAQGKKEELLHAIEVLRRSETPPPGWNQHINSLYDNALRDSSAAAHISSAPP